MSLPLLIPDSNQTPAPFDIQEAAMNKNIFEALRTKFQQKPESRIT